MQSLKPADAVLKVDDELAFVQVAEIDLGAMRSKFRGPLQTAPAMRRRAPENLRRRKHDKICPRKTEPAGECALEQINSA